MSSLLLKNAVPCGKDHPCDIMIEEGFITAVEKAGTAEFSADRTIDCEGMTAFPGLFDMHVHFRDPGFTYKEDIVTGCAAAAAGGVRLHLPGAAAAGAGGSGTGHGGCGK